MGYKVIISTSGLNSYGSRVLTEGINYAQYQRNPILLWMHNRPFRGTTDEVLPIGTVEGLEVVEGKLTGTLKFDEADPFAKRIKEKWDAGILKMVSPGLDVIELSDDPVYLVAGQTRSTITKSKLREISVVDLGSNDEALALYNEGKRLNLAAGEGGEILKPIQKPLKMEKIALKLGLNEKATEAEILLAVQQLQADAAKAITLSKEMDKIKQANITALVDQAIKMKRITAEKRDHFISLGNTSGATVLSDTLELIAPAVKPTEVIGGKGGAAPKSYTKLSDVPEVERIQLRETDRDQYAKLYKAEYGIEPSF